MRFDFATFGSIAWWTHPAVPKSRLGPIDEETPGARSVARRKPDLGRAVSLNPISASRCPDLLCYVRAGSFASHRPIVRSDHVKATQRQKASFHAA